MMGKKTPVDQCRLCQTAEQMLDNTDTVFIKIIFSSSWTEKKHFTQAIKWRYISKKKKKSQE
jgi:hypothetical protein